MSSTPIQHAAVIGPTAWGTTLAILLARNAVPTTLFARSEDEAERLHEARENTKRLPGVAFPDALEVSADPSQLERAQLVTIAVPSRSFAANLEQTAAHFAAGATVVSATKGLELASGRRMSELLAAAAPQCAVAVLSGPNLSAELAAGLPGTTVLASTDAPLDAVRAAFHSGSFRVYTSNDVVGVELGGALKNVIAIAAGAAEALGLGDNAKAAIVTRGLAEITRLGVAAGADALTFQGLAGIGDLAATAFSPLSRNRRLGALTAGGATLEQARAQLDGIAEGADTIPAALTLAARLGVEMPITEALRGVLFEGVPFAEAVATLMEREPTSELEARAGTGTAAD
ncbi:MAG: NAD(P)H-dependent glycerol-3-phosphate dehydrogenase [Dehalococcoidia bacterium]